MRSVWNLSYVYEYLLRSIMNCHVGTIQIIIGHELLIVRSRQIAHDVDQQSPTDNTRTVIGRTLHLELYEL
jgi:hypothetical protein